MANMLRVGYFYTLIHGEFDPIPYFDIAGTI